MNKSEEVNNYIVFKKGRFVSQIAYVDIKEHMADDFFASCNFPIKFSKQEGHKPGSDYCIVLCRIPTKRLDEFNEMMRDMTIKMLLTGHADYMDFCDGLNFLRKEVEKEEKDDR